MYGETVLEQAQREVTEFVRSNPDCTVDDVSVTLGITIALAGQALRQAVLYEDISEEMRNSRKHYKCGGRLFARKWLTRKWA